MGESGFIPTQSSPPLMGSKPTVILGVHSFRAFPEVPFSVSRPIQKLRVVEKRARKPKKK